MKKRCFIKFILVLVILISCGCTHSIYDDLVSNGDFKYYYFKDEDCYVALDLTEQGRQKEILYIPAQFNKKNIEYTNIQISSLAGVSSAHLWANNAEKIYFPYSHQIYNNLASNNNTAIGVSDKIREIYVVNVEKEYIWYMQSIISGDNIFVTQKGYERIRDEIKKRYEGVQEIETYMLTYILHFGESNVRECMQVANTSYMFNYEDCPNDGYFFIDNRDYGAKIKDTPYEPLRDGYTFAGWYKEPECIHKWDFDKDTLPEAKQNEQGGMIYQETKLYAKWIEK